MVWLLYTCLWMEGSMSVSGCCLRLTAMSMKSQMYVKLLICGIEKLRNIAVWVVLLSFFYAKPHFSAFIVNVFEPLNIFLLSELVGWAKFGLTVKLMSFCLLVSISLSCALSLYLSLFLFLSHTVSMLKKSTGTLAHYSYVYFWTSFCEIMVLEIFPIRHKMIR